MNDWIIFAVGCFATLLAGSGAGLLIYAVNTDEGIEQDRASRGD
jgi:hypothetical protein